MIKWIVPNLRFPEFEGEWEKKKLLDIGKIITGSTPSTRNEAFYNGEYLFVSPVDIQSNRYVKRTKTTLTKKGFEKGRKIPKGSSLFVCIGSTIGKVGQAKSICITNQQINSITSLEGSNDFLYSLLECHAPKIKILAAAQAVPIINKTTFSNIKINIPFSEEQSKIGSFFYLIDKKIDTQIKTIEELKNLKTGMSQRIFAREIKFKDENENYYPDWNTKRLGDILAYEQPTNYLVSSTEYNDEFCIPVVTAGKTFVLGFTDETEGIFKKEKLPVIIFDDFTTSCQYVNFPFKTKSSAMKILKIKNDDNIKFIYEAMQNVRYEVGGHRRHWISVFSNIKILIPSLPEQQKIANFLSAIDKKIEIETQILKKLKEQKKFFLQNLFV